MRWHGAVDGFSREEAEAGLRWALSLLGADPVADPVRWDDEEPTSLDVDLAELATRDLSALLEVRSWAAATGETDARGGIEVGRFLLRSLHDPWIYYRATGACGTLDAWSAEHPTQASYAVVDSTFTESHRLVRLATEFEDWSGVAFSVAEGDGDLLDGSFAAAEHEVVHVLPSGQFAYAIYGGDGALRAAASAAPAGTPAKCAWCHEAAVQLGREQPETAPGSVNSATFFEVAGRAQDAIEARRAGHPGSVDWGAATDVHTWAEWLVEGFLYPSAARVAAEWGVDVTDVEALDLPRRDNEEWGWASRLSRADADAAAPWSVLAVQADPRELDATLFPIEHEPSRGCP